MGAVVTNAFTCRIDGLVYRAGDEYDGGADRIAELAAKGFVEAPEKPKQPAKRPARKAAAK